MFAMANQMGSPVQMWLDDYPQRSSNSPKTASNFMNHSAKTWVNFYAS
jgi:hypothetical protein